MDNPTVSWEIRDENDRIISILAWVVVVVLVVYAMIFFYKQIHQPSRSARPVVTPVTEEGGATQVASRTDSARPRAVVTKISAELDDLPPTSKKVGAALATAEQAPATGGVELDIGQYATPTEAIAAMRELEDVAEWNVRIRAKNEGYTLRTGPLPEAEVATIESSLKGKGMTVERHSATGAKGVGSLSSSTPSRKGSTKPAAKKTEKAAAPAAPAAKKNEKKSPAPRTVRVAAPALDVPGDVPGDVPMVETADAPPRARAPRQAPEASGSGYYLQVVTYAEPEMAQETKQRYTESGIRAKVEKVPGRANTWYRVMVGAYGSKQEALGEQSRIAGLIGVKPSELVLRKR